MINRTKIGAIYTPCDTDGRRIAVNKILFLFAVILLYSYNIRLTDCVAVVALSVPIVKKCTVNLLDGDYGGEYALILSAEILLVSLGNLHNAVAVLVTYHIFDFILFLSYNGTLTRFLKKLPIFEKIINYRFTDDGDYILSNNEYVPLEGVVVAGEALVDFGRISGDGDDVIPVHTSDKILPACRITDGNIILKPLKKIEDSVYERIKKVYSEAVYNKKVSGFSKFFDIYKVLFTVVFLVISAVALRCGAKTNFDISIYINATAMFGCSGVMLIFSNAVEYTFFAHLAENGIYAVNRSYVSEARILEKDGAFGAVDFSEYDLYSARLTSAEARKIYNRYKDQMLLKRKILLALIIVNAVAAVVAMLLSSTLYIFLSLIITAAILAGVTAI